MSTNIQWSSAERAYVDDRKNTPPVPASERIATIVIENFPDLGMLAALRFLEWVCEHPDGVVSLPTGKTPEYFIHWTQFFLSQWNTKQAQKILARHGIERAKPPSLKGLRFVQIDEFYPIDTEQKNSFYYYIQRFYIDGFGLDGKRALMIDPNRIGIPPGETLEEVWPQYHVDLSLRERAPRSFIEERQQRALTAVDQFCDDYEAQIHAAGGIGFFLGGIGPDGHIGFNVRGASHHSTTRLCATNYETQAAAAVDLGGIEISRTRLVITIGLATITHNPECVAIIIAAGDAKAAIVSSAICAPASVGIPAAALRSLPHARFYITEGAAKRLEERNYLKRKRDPVRLKNDSARIITELALRRGKKITDLTADDFSGDILTGDSSAGGATGTSDAATKRKATASDTTAVANAAAKSGIAARGVATESHTAAADSLGNLSAALLAQELGGDLRPTIERLTETYRTRITDALQLPSGQTFLHTAPHHDDIMLGYIPYLARLIRDPSNTHYFNYLTSGFTSVANNNLCTHIELAQTLIDAHEIFDPLEQSDYFNHTNTTFRDRDTLEHLDGVAAKDESQANFGTARRFLRNLNQLYGVRTRAEFTQRLEQLLRHLRAAYPGMKDIPEIQQLKGMIREWEADLLWGFFGFDSQSVIHSRLGFYKGDIFTEQPQYERDVKPIVATLTAVRPTVISVALDPEGSGPDTHYKVLQATAAALEQYQKESERDDIEVWGYRNVWCRYEPYEANQFIPVSLMSMAVMQQTFLKSFLSQAEASFPSYEFDGPFSELAQKVQVEQYLQLLTLLGRGFFYQSKDSRIRSTRGMIFLKKMTLDQFYAHSRALQKSIS